MAESPPFARPPITFEDLQDFFKEREIKGACPTCGRSEYSIPGHSDKDGMEGVGVFSVDKQSRPLGGNVLAASYMPMIVINCTNCGTPRFFAWSVIEAWKKAKTGNPV